ncbi:CDP-diacylglycerol diphosphatase [Asaia bogorensis]|uniref:CDP-diacylglycerol pyrophosphatase n=1 Tax=Asaia bogorensis NBRC 16594 TaxID=1231624 RepID=A0AAN4U1K3_9PROT|nr:CDP-diacylglycerol diphosphatase [Asaia bogorensis]BAT19996.1 CDP-diacylglycerol pyrophosphatase [Asaia bogorensis NBRC 16594]GBQ80828.1 CDP-diacylglycerol pyrophosphatase [Asaia bogorensis NBRC 16594]GEL52586.1 CDP-diacylglycerol diphosphatase [Asaia bogorensis NBRC 16594]
MLKSFLLLTVAVLTGISPALASPPGLVIHKDHDPDVLWKLVHGRCARGLKPCTVYDETHGFALLHSIEGRGQYLLIPTEKVTGMESAVLLRPEQPNYFAEAWAYRERVGQDYHRSIPESELSLAINSAHGRSQNQLHIHLDCIDVRMRALLDRNTASIGPSWSYLPESFNNHHYRALYLATMNGSPFRILAANLAHPEEEMGNHTLIVTPLGTGYVLLDDVVGGDDRASGEEIQDHRCQGRGN